MGEKDIVTTRYMNNDLRYADLLNAYLFRGEERVKPEDVHEMDPRVIAKSKKMDERKNIRIRQKTKDMVRKVVFGTGITIISLENQNLVHYAMPIRTMIEDAFEYHGQLDKIQKQHYADQDLKLPGERIGGFASTDEIYPSITIVLYYGEEEWDGAKDLLDLVNMSAIPKEIRELVNGYPLHLLEVRKFENIDLFKTDLREVFGAIQNGKNKEQLRDFMNANVDAINNLDEDARDMITAFTGIKRKNAGEQKGDANMGLCQGLKEWLEDERREGAIDAKIGVLQKFLMQLGEIPESIIKRITNETDDEILDAWIKNACLSKTMDEFIIKCNMNE